MFLNRITCYILVIFLFCISCKKNKIDEDILTRNFLMGFTPWPYDATQEAVDWTYATIFSQGDIISHHMEEGVPWQESYENTDFPQEFMNEIHSRMSKDYSNHSILLSLNPLNMERNSLALDRGASEEMPLAEPWDTYSFSSIKVKVAYEQYATSMITYFIMLNFSRMYIKKLRICILNCRLEFQCFVYHIFLNGHLKIICRCN